MTWGVLRPVILLPADAGDWTHERLTTALLHELAHVRRRDFLTRNWRPGPRARFYWFNPMSVARPGPGPPRAGAGGRRRWRLGCRARPVTRMPATCWRSSRRGRRPVRVRPWRRPWHRPRNWSAGCASSSTRTRAVASRAVGPSAWSRPSRRGCSSRWPRSTPGAKPRRRSSPPCPPSSPTPRPRPRTAARAPGRRRTRSRSSPKPWRKSATSTSSRRTSRRSARARSAGCSRRSTTRTPSTSMPSGSPT